MRTGTLVSSVFFATINRHCSTLLFILVAAKVSECRDFQFAFRHLTRTLQLEGYNNIEYVYVDYTADDTGVRVSVTIPHFSVDVGTRFH